MPALQGLCRLVTLAELLKFVSSWSRPGAGLNLLLELLVMFERSEYATQFHQTYYLQLMREIFVVMTGARSSDEASLHTSFSPSFKLPFRTAVLYYLQCPQAHKSPAWPPSECGPSASYPFIS